MNQRRVNKMLTDFDDKMAILNHFKAVLEVDGSNPNGKLFYKYKGDWSDQKVAEKFGYDRDSISRFRVARKMDLNPRSIPRPNNFSPLRLEQNKLHERFAQLEAKVAESDREASRRTAELATLMRELHTLRDEVGRLRTVQNNHAQAINALEEATTRPRPIKSFGDIKR